MEKPRLILRTARIKEVQEKQIQQLAQQHELTPAVIIRKSLDIGLRKLARDLSKLDDNTN